METKPIVRNIISLSSSFLNSASILSKKCLEIEQKIKPGNREKLIEEHQAYFYGVIFNLVSYLESYINELFVDISDGTFHNLNMDDTSLYQIIELWNLNIPRRASYKTIDKYEIMLIISNKPKFDKSKRPYQDIDLLIRLRNSLIHYEPEYIELTYLNPNAQLHKFEKALKGKFKLNPFATKLDTFYPNKIISYSCSQWALEAVKAFIKEFDNEIFKK